MEPTPITSFDQLISFVSSFLPVLVAALLILIVGWILAALASRAVRMGLRKSGLGSRVASLAGSDPKLGDTAILWVGRIVFWLLMLLVFVGFFQVLGLNQVTEPLLGLLNQVFEYLPRLLGPAVLLVIGLALAAGLRILVRRGLSRIKFDQWFKSEGDDELTSQAAVQSIAEAVYWLTLLLFLPAILYSLGIGGLLEPVRGMVEETLSFLPNLLAAGLIFVVGWFIARVLRRIATKLVQTLGIDRLSENVGLKKALGEQNLSGLVGLLVYILVLIPVIVGGLNALNIEAVTGPASQMLYSFLLTLPLIFAAALVLGVALIVGRLIASLSENVLRSIGFNALPERLGLPAISAKDLQPSQLAGRLVLIAIMLFATIEALELIEFGTIAELLASFIVFAGNVLIGVAIIAFGLYLSRVTADSIRAARVTHAPLVALTARSAILVLGVAMGLGQMGLGEDIIVLAFGILFGAVALALAIAFGFGGRETAGRLFGEWVDSLGTGKSDKD